METKTTDNDRLDPVEAADVYSNATYLVYAIRRNGIVRLISIRRHDWNPCADWRDKQALKNQIAGAECEAAELYPADSRVVDKSNWSHLWCLPPGEKFSFGFLAGVKSNGGTQAGQRPLAERGDKSALVKSRIDTNSDEEKIVFPSSQARRMSE